MLTVHLRIFAVTSLICLTVLAACLGLFFYLDNRGADTLSGLFSPKGLALMTAVLFLAGPC